MNWKKLLAETPFVGSVCNFVEIDSENGVKFYEYEDSRDYCFAVQKFLEELNLAPPVGEKIDIESPWYDCERIYGYYTKIADRIVDDLNMDDDEWNDIEAEYWDRIDPLYDILDSNGARWRDVHIGNVGFYPRGTDNLVVIDMDGIDVNVH